MAEKKSHLNTNMDIKWEGKRSNNVNFGFKYLGRTSTQNLGEGVIWVRWGTSISSFLGDILSNEDFNSYIQQAMPGWK